MSLRLFLVFRRKWPTSSRIQTQTSWKVGTVSCTSSGVDQEARVVQEVSRMAGVPVLTMSQHSCDLLNEETIRL